jgi:hypothetical protein
MGGRSKGGAYRASLDCISALCTTSARTVSPNREPPNLALGHHASHGITVSRPRHCRCRCHCHSRCTASPHRRSAAPRRFRPAEQHLGADEAVVLQTTNCRLQTPECREEKAQLGRVPFAAALFHLNALACCPTIHRPSTWCSGRGHVSPHSGPAASIIACHLRIILISTGLCTSPRH